MATQIFSISNGVVTIQSDDQVARVPLSLLLIQDSQAVFVTGINEYWKSVDGTVVAHQIGTASLPATTGVTGVTVGTPQWIDLLDYDPLTATAANFIPPSRAPYCDRVEEFQALMDAIEASAGVVPPAEKRRRLSQAVQGSEIFRRAYSAAKASSAVNAALTMVVQFVTGAADIADEILFRYFADLVKELGELGAPHELTDEDMDALEQMFGSAGYDTTRLFAAIATANQ